MTPRHALLALPLLLGACGGDVPIYVGDRLVYDPAAQAAAPSAGDECQRLALRAADPAITDDQRRAAAQYRASLGC
jgi:hypothetical protein